MSHSSPLSRYALLLLALLALAGNSLLCRTALVDYAADPGIFSLLRVLSGALVLWLIVTFRNLVYAAELKQTQITPKAPSTRLFSAFTLFVYFITFSYAYIWLDTGIGALVLFGMVQITIALTSIHRGHSVRINQWIGMALAISGLYLLVYTGISKRGWAGYLLMALAGIGWGFYTLSGRGSRDPLRDNAINFSLALPPVIVALFFSGSLDNTESWHAHRAILLAIFSGAVTSGIGYALWFYVVRQLDAMSSGIAQLTVPLIAAMGGTLFLGESFSLQMMLGAGLILGGVLWAMVLER